MGHPPSEPDVDPWAVLTALAHPVVVVDDAGRIRYRNPAAISEGLDATSSDAVMAAARHVVSQRAPASIEHSTEGHCSAVEIRPCPVGEGGGAVLAYRDITAAKKFASSLAELEERFRTLVDGSPDIVFITDASSRMTYANAALEEQTGYTVADFQMPQGENQLIHPDDRARVAAFIGEFVASGRKYSGPLRNRFIARDGRVLWYSSVISRSEWAGEPVLQFVVHNITEQERAREELARVQAQLFEKERLASLGELAAIVAHEIRNPVSIIYNALTTLRKSPPAEDANVLLAIVDDEAARLQRTVRDLLDFTRPLAPSFEPCDLATIVNAALEAVISERPGENASRVRVAYEAVAPPYFAEVDRHMIHRVIVNLVANAFQAMPNGGELTMKLETSEGIGGAGKEAAVAITVQDSGPGIATDAAARIFEPFFTTRATGTGLGLALVKRIVELHRGTIAAANAPEGGARFFVSLPVAQRGS